MKTNKFNIAKLVILLSILAITVSVHRISATQETYKTYKTNNDIRSYNSSKTKFKTNNQLKIHYQENNDKKEQKVAVIYVGDSRTLGMQQSVQELPDEFFICEVGKGLNWLKQEAIPQIDTTLKINDYDKYKIVFLFGVNDLWNIQNYKEYYSYLINEKYKNCELYFCSVNPVIDGMSNAYNKDIDNFNNMLKNYDNYIDTNSLIKDNFSSTDGLHYDAKTYNNIYRIIKNNI